ncbi:PMT family glycosyltransferase, 4-amino-4-deoxy-L-arabinose transferase [Mycolicibacterium aurum]|uniref:PMT family glycosyltransferase, 4-amino-4-deoxy-L-arabinose transferase n=1 Tax=Mycolicibacterium aurum TaxID=1791 RepID=A0A3S4RI93_MYCAU|nr:glycosyltransferase family 39 protein [Mycolicibacterium aurum]VEG51069.1 PMT family glycosyltransferase, 4-amino-4-deoxy-L-arabinose transferase [Mycolicibacterium aurum]
MTASETRALSDPRWVKPSLGALLVATAAFWAVGLSRNGWGNTFYAAAVQAGTRSGKAFLFGSSDAANSITVDKPPASLWVMEISTRLFGVNSWALQLPQVLLGVASVGLLYAAVRKPFGPAAGLIAGALLALTPVATLMFRYNNPDALLVFLMVAATWALLRGVDSGRTRWVVLCGALIGFGFLTKQLQVMLILPALAIAYLVAGTPRRWWARLLQLFAGLGAAVVAAGWWVALVELWPEADRPYIGGSANNSFLQLTLGYNGLGRIFGGGAGGAGGLPGPPPGNAGPGPEGPAMFGSAGITRMFSTESGTQISWLLPAALVLLIAGLVLCGRAPRTDRRRASYVIWGGWLLVTGLVFSFMSGIFHDYYTVALAPGVAAVVGMGSVHLWQNRDKRWVTIVVALVVGLTAAWAWMLLGRTPDFVPALRWIVAGLGAVATTALAVCAARPGVTAAGRDLTSWAAALGVVAALAGPVAFCVHTVGSAHHGPIVVAGPSTTGGMPAFPAAEGPDGRAGPPPGQSEPSEEVSRLLAVDSEDFTWVAAAKGSLDSAGYQLATGDPVMPLGGFGGADPSPTLEQFQDYVKQRRIHYYIESSLPGMPPRAEGPDSTWESDRISDWIAQRYTAMSVDGVTLYDLTSPR